LEVQKSFTWLTNNLHGLRWEGGQYPHDRLSWFVESIKLRYPHSLFFAKGFEKCVFLSRLFNREFTDLEDVNCPKISELETLDICCGNPFSIHSNSGHCARKKARAFAIWLQKYLKEHDESENTAIKRIDDLCLNHRQA
jgi:hypothetical protein